VGEKLNADKTAGTYSKRIVGHSQIQVIASIPQERLTEEGRRRRKVEFKDSPTRRVLSSLDGEVMAACPGLIDHIDNRPQ
jgi:hypothetical protein